MRRRIKTLTTAGLLLLLAAAFAWHWQVTRGPVYQGRHIGDWVDEALHSDSATNATAVVLQIGGPAVPYIARQGLYGRSHVFTFLTSSRLQTFSAHHHRTSVWLDLLDWDVCVTRHDRARRLLLAMGDDARPAIPDIIDCLEHCPELHYMNTLGLQDTLAKISGTNSAALAYFTRCARADNDLHAAALAYQIDGNTNFFIKICETIAVTNLYQLATSSDLYRLREDHELNKQIIPLLERIYSDPKVMLVNRAVVLSQLQWRGDDATNALARIHDIQLNNPARPVP